MKPIPTEMRRNMPNSRSVGTKLLSFFALFLVLLGTTVGIAYYGIHLAQKSADDVIASQDLLVEMQHYESCARSVLLQAALGLILQNGEREAARLKVDAEIQAIEEKVSNRFAERDAAIFDEVQRTYQHFVSDNNRWYEVERLRAEEKNRFETAGERVVQTMKTSIAALQDAMNILDANEEDVEMVNSRVMTHVRKMDVGLGKVMFLHHSYFELLEGLSYKKKKDVATTLLEDIRELMFHLGETGKIISAPEYQQNINEVIDAFNDWAAILASIFEMMMEQSRILERHANDDATISELLNVLMASVRKHTEELRNQSRTVDARMLQVEILLAALTVIVGLILAYAALRHYAGNLERAVCERTAEVFQLQTAVLNTVADLMEFRDQLTGGHNARTQRYLQILTEELIRSGEYKDEVAGWNMDFFLSSAQLHDVGKIAIPDGILNKPGTLTEIERTTMQGHTTVGIDALKRIMSNTKEHAFLRHALAIVGAHHEKWDGSGYPGKLIGQDIPLEGRLMAIADVYDALISERPYKKAFPHEEACRIIESESGFHFDPALVAVFLRIKDAFIAVSEKEQECN